MKTRKIGKRYPLLLYRRAMDRLWKPTLFLGLILLVSGLSSFFLPIPLFHSTNETWLLVGAAVALAFGVFALVARSMAYVQPRSNHLSVVTPFLHLKISYRRIRSVHPSSFQQLFPPVKAGWAEKQFLEPFYGKTAVVLELQGYPMSRALLKLFLPRHMFSKQLTGLILLVPDWMELSTELDSQQGRWLQQQNRRVTLPGSSSMS